MITCGTQIVSGAPIYGGGGGGTLPDAPADVLLDATKPSTIVGLNASGVGEALNAASALARIGAVPTTRSVSTSSPLTGGGALSGDLTLAISVGTTAGTVAAGNDSRITGAVPTSRIFGGLNLSADRSATDVLASLGARILAPDTGWTDFTTGVGPSITHAGGVQTLNNPSNTFAWMRRTAISTPEAPSVEIMGRFTVTTGNPATAWFTALGLTNGADDRGYLAQVSETGSLGIWLNSGSGYTLVSGSGAISRTSGVWVRLIVTPSYVSAAWGTTGTSTPPTTWTVTASAATNVGVLASGQLLRHGIRAGRTASGSGTYTVEWTDVQYRILGVSP